LRQPEGPVEQAERHVQEGEVRVARQMALVSRLATRGFDPTVAEEVLENLRTALGLARDHLRHETEIRGSRA
jgi:hypothetical protein